jgi:hypothetical protein
MSDRDANVRDLVDKQDGTIVAPSFSSTDQGRGHEIEPVS